MQSPDSKSAAVSKTGIPMQKQPSAAPNVPATLADLTSPFVAAFPFAFVGESRPGTGMGFDRHFAWNSRDAPIQSAGMQTRAMTMAIYERHSSVKLSCCSSSRELQAQHKLPAADSHAMASSQPAAAAAHEPPKRKKNLAVHLFAGGVAGSCEAVTCHPLDTIKVRLQLRGERAARRPPAAAAAGTAAQAVAAEAAKPKRQSFIGVGYQIVQKEGFLSLYKGLGAVISGIVPKMAIRFSSFEYYKELLSGKDRNNVHSASIFLAGLGAGATESVLVVTPMDVIKIRLQAQRHSMTDPLDIPKYRNAAHCTYVMVKEEGIASLYKGVTLTVLRQGTNQAANFTVYEYLKKRLREMQPDAGATLPPWQTLIMGFISGACGPLFNAPIDTIKTRIQRSPSSERGWARFVNITRNIIKNEGYAAFYKGLTPRVLRVAPGQAITFMVYERVYAWVTALSQNLHVEELDRVGLKASEPNANET